MKPTQKATIGPAVVLREKFNDWAILFHPLTGEAVGTGPVGMVIWKLLNESRLVAVGTHQSLLESDEFYRTLVARQQIFAGGAA